MVSVKIPFKDKICSNKNKLETLTEIEHIKQYDFGNFMAIRLAYWAMMVSIAVLVIGTTPIHVYFNMSKSSFGKIVMLFLTILLVVMSRIIHKQHSKRYYCR